MIQTHLAPWTGEAVRHIPEGPFDPLDFSRAGLAADNRWNAKGEPTLYLACNQAVALAEMARHLREDRSPALMPHIRRRQVYRFGLAFQSTLDLTHPDTLSELSIRGAPQCFLDKAIARATAQFVRQLTQAQAIFVPSAAFLDQPDQWVLVVFLEKLADNPKGFITSVAPDGIFAVG